MAKKKKKKRTRSKSGIGSHRPSSTSEEKPHSDGIIAFLNRFGLYILCVFVIAYIIVYGYTCFRKYETFSYYDFDLAIYNQVTWNTLHGDFMYSSIRENVYNMDGVNKRVGIYFKDHAPVILLFFLPIYAVFQTPLTLLMLQTIFLAAAAIPLFLLARRELHGGWGLVFGLVYLIYPAVGYINLFEFHPLCFAPFFLLFAFYFYRIDRFRPFIIFLALAMFCKEEVAITVFMFGIYVLIDRARKKDISANKRWIITPAVMGIFWALLTYKILAPMFNEKGYIYTDLFKEMGGSFGGIVKKTLTDPVYTLKHIFKIQKPMLNRPLYLLKLFLPIGFLSLLSPLTLLITLPQLFLYLASSKAATSTIYFQYTGAVIPVLFISAVMGVRFLSSRIRPGKYWPAGAAAVLILGTVTSIVWGPQFRLFDKDWDYTGANTLWAYNRIYSSDSRDDMRQHMADLIPPDASVVTSFRFLDKLSSRRHIYSLHYIFLGREMITQIKYATPEKMEYALLDYSEPWLFQQLQANKNTRIMQEIFLDPERKYGVEKVIDGFVLLKEGEEDLSPLFEVLDNPPEEPPKTVLRKPFQVPWKKDTPPLELALMGTDNEIIKTDEFEQLQITSYWQCDEPGPLTIYLGIELMADRPGRGPLILTRRSYPLCYEIHPTKLWEKNELVKSKHYIALPPRIEPGKYKIRFQVQIKEMGAAFPPFDAGEFTIPSE